MLIIKTHRDNLLKPLSQCAGIVERKHTLPVLANVLIKKTENSLSFVTTDIEVQIATKIDHQQGGQDLETTVNARKFLDIIRALPDTEDISLEQIENKLIIKSGKSKYTLQTLEAAEFPIMSAGHDWDLSVSLSQGKLKNLLTKVHFSMAQQDIRYYLNGLLLAFEGKLIKSIATDGHRLAYYHIDSEKDIEKDTEINFPKTDLIIPRKTILELVRLLADSDEKIKLSANKNLIQFELGNTVFVSKLIEGKFPDYNRVIPINHPKSIKINRSEFHSALQRAAILTSDKFKGIRLNFDKNLLKAQSTNTEQEEACEEIIIDYTYETLDIGFNVGYILDVLTNIKQDEITMSLSDGNASTLITTSLDENFKYVVMPMRI